MESVLNGELGEVLDALDTALDGVGAAGVDPADHRDAVAVLKRVERIGVRIDAVRVAVMESVDDKLLYAADGHFSAKVMVRHVNKLSGVNASRRWSMVRALREMPELKAAFEAGDIGTPQTHLLARVFSNKRVREQLIADQGHFIDLAVCCSFRDFESAVGDWVRLVDEDGTADTAQANHENRDLKLVQDFDGGWVISGRCGSIQGAQLEDILKRFIDAEFKTDWERAKSLYGDNVVKDQLERTDAQRRFDAFLEIMMRGATNYGPGARPAVVTTIVLDHETFERELAKVFGGDPEPVDPWSLDFASRTINGAMINTTEAAVAALVRKFKRAVIDAASVTVDMSRDTRFFTGNARLAVQIGSTHCTWPGCHVPASDCRADKRVKNRGHQHDQNPHPDPPAWTSTGFVSWRVQVFDWKFTGFFKQLFRGLEIWSEHHDRPRSIAVRVEYQVGTDRRSFGRIGALSEVSHWEPTMAQ